MSNLTSDVVLAAYRTCGYEKDSLPTDHLPDSNPQEVWGLLAELVTTGIVQLGENPGEIVGEAPSPCATCGKDARRVLKPTRFGHELVYACKDCYAPA